MTNDWIQCIVAFLLSFLSARSMSSKGLWQEIDITTVLILDVVENLAKEENAKCAIMVDEGRQYAVHQRSQYEDNESLALTLFKASDGTGESLAQSGKFCPFYVMNFQSSKKALQFLDINTGNIRKRNGRYIFIIKDISDVHMARYFFNNPIFDNILQVVLLAPTSNGDFASYQKTACKGDRLVIKRNIWNLNRGFVLEKSPMFANNILDDLSCKSFKATSFHYPPSTTIYVKSSGLIKFGGIEFLIFDAISKKLNFEYNISQPKICCLWGRAEDGGKNFSGLVGDLFNGYTDIAWAHLFFTLERSEFIDYTDAYMFDYGGFMVLKSKPLPPWMNTFQSFSPTLWVYIFGTMRVFADVFDPFLLFYISCKQSKDVTFMSSDGLRIFLIFYAFAFYIITTGYKGTLVSCLAIPFVPSVIDTIEELAHSPLRIETLFKGGMGLVEGISPKLDLLVEKYFTVPDPENPEGAISRLRDGKIARKGFESKLSLQYDQRVHFTNMYAETTTHIISENFKQHSVAFALQKDSIFTQKFGEIIRNLNEAGLIQHWKANEMDKVGRLDGAKRSSLAEESPYIISQMLAPFEILLAGILLGFISLLVEIRRGKKTMKC